MIEIIELEEKKDTDDKGGWFFFLWDLSFYFYFYFFLKWLLSKIIHICVTRRQKAHVEDTTQDILNEDGCGGKKMGWERRKTEMGKRRKKKENKKRTIMIILISEKSSRLLKSLNSWKPPPLPLSILNHRIEFFLVSLHVSLVDFDLF